MKLTRKTWLPRQTCHVGSRQPWSPWWPRKGTIISISSHCTPSFWDCAAQKISYYRWNTHEHYGRLGTTSVTACKSLPRLSSPVTHPFQSKKSLPSQAIKWAELCIQMDTQAVTVKPSCLPASSWRKRDRIDFTWLESSEYAIRGAIRWDSCRWHMDPRRIKCKL